MLDLRGNPGGVVTAALETASLFLEPGATVFTIRGRSVPEKAEKAPESAKPYRFKLVVLVNEKTASASEIVSGALQDHDRATIVGEPSYGKGLVQSVYPLSGGAGLALTTALYYTPSGRSIQKPLDVNEFELGADHGPPQCTVGVPHRQGARGDGRRRDPAGFRRHAGAAEPSARSPDAQRILYRFRHRVSPRATKWTQISR